MDNKLRIIYAEKSDGTFGYLNDKILRNIGTSIGPKESDVELMMLSHNGDLFDVGIAEMLKHLLYSFGYENVYVLKTYRNI